MDILYDLRREGSREAAFEALFRRFHGQVCRFLARRGTAPEDCRDLTQEVFLAVYKGMPDLRDERQFVSWLFTIARNVSLNHVAKQHARKRDGVRVFRREEDRDGEEPGMDAFPAPAASPLDDLIKEQRHSRLVEALASLPAQMRRCVQLRVAGECPYEEIALTMGISVNTVKAHLHQARKNLKEKLAADFDEVEVT